MLFAKKSTLSSILLCLAFCFSSYAQTPTAVVTGTVLDSSGAVVPGATVKVVNQDTNIVSAKQTNGAGLFTIINLLPGRYVLTVTKAGFKTVALPVFELEVNQTLNQSITMPVGAATETVEVSASSVAATIQSATTELGTTVDEVEMHELPLNGRNFTQLLLLQPGVNPVNTAQGSNGIGSADGGNIGIPGTVVYRPSVNGAGNRSNAFYMDGIVNTDDRGGGWAIPPIADTIQEFKVQSHNNDAQYGNVLGAVVNIVTKTGTNHFHGSGWEFARRNIFDARNPFTGFCTAATCPSLAQSPTLSSTPVSPPDYSQNEFGGTFGGPIRKDKTFFYIAYEGWRYSSPADTFAIVPTAQELAGDFSGTVTPELIGIVNSTKTAIAPNTIFNPFAESGKSSSVPFTCDGSGNPMALANPGAAFGATGYGVQVAGGSPCNKIPAALVDPKLASAIAAYTAPQLKNCAFTPNFAIAVFNCLDSRQHTDSANNMDARIDQHFGTKDTVFARAYMLWDSNVNIDPGTTSLSPSPYHTWNIGGAWDHIFTPNLILEARGGINARPVLVNQTNAQGFQPEVSAGFSNLSATNGFYTSPSGYLASSGTPVLGNVGPEHRANPEADFNGMMTWVHGKHNFRFGGSYLYENREETNLFTQFSSSTAQTCPTNGSGLFACANGQGNSLASLLLDLPSNLKVNVPQLEEIHVRINPIGTFFQDEWHVRPNLTINVGLRYDYDPAVTLLNSNGQTVNAIDLPHSQYLIGSTSTAAYTSGCGSPVVPPCVPGGLASTNPAFQVTVGGVTYNTLNNIQFTGSQAGLQAIKDNIGPRVGIAWQFMHNTVARVGYGIFYDPISYRSQYAENTLQGSIWPFTNGVNTPLNTAPIGAAAAPTVNPICNSPASCGPFGGYSTSQLSGLVGSNPVVVAPTPWGSTFGGFTNAPNYSDPRSQQWNLQIERQLTASSMVSVAYVGSRTQRLEFCCKANFPQGGPFCQNNAAAGFTCPTTPLTANQINQLEYMPWAAQGWNYSQSTGYSNYNAFETQFQKRFSQGLQTLVAFTWEKCLGDSNGGFGAENGAEGAPVQYYFNPASAKGPCAFDIPKVFNWSGVYELPFGHGKKWLQGGPLSWILGNWETNFSYLARSGQAFNPSWGGSSGVCTTAKTTGCVPVSIGGVAPGGTDPANLSNAGGSITGYTRPSVLPGCDLTAGRNANQWFNPACFVSPSSPAVGPGYGFGDAPIGNLRSQNFWNVDFALAKNIPIKESMKLQFRAEAFNIFNHMVLGVPGNSNGTSAPSIAPSFSTAANAVSYGTAAVVSSLANGNNPRELQFAVKFSF
jgi:hypothetical protein